MQNLDVLSSIYGVYWEELLQHLKNKSLFHEDYISKFFLRFCS